MIVMIIVTRKMSVKYQNHVPDIKKTLFEHFWNQKWVSRPNRPRSLEPPAPFLMTKSVQKLLFYCLGHLIDIFALHVFL